MEDKDKYYTPEAEDLNIGLIIEHLTDKGEWAKETIKCFMLNYNVVDLSWFEKNKHKIRVKKLDILDIEEAGWEYSKSSEHKVDYFTKDKHYLIFSQSKQRIVIGVYSDRGHTDTAFIGTILNFNELVKIMKMVGI